MTKLLPSRPLTATILVLLPAFAMAWTPYSCGLFNNSNATAERSAGLNAPGMPYPGMPGFGNPWYGAAPGFPGTPYGYGTRMPGTGFAPMSAPQGIFPRFGRMNGPPGYSLTRSATSDAYILDITLTDMEPTRIQVDIQGPWIRIGSKNTREDSREERFDDGRGFMRSYRYSTGSDSRRIALPHDANPAGMTRKDAADSVRIVIPRAAR